MKLLLFALAVLLSHRAAAQPTAPTDVLLLVNGDEIAGRVLAVSGNSISYCALNQPDTLRFDTDAVFLIRFANGTREVMAGNWTAAVPPPPPAAPDALPGLSTAQRRALGLRDASQNYRNRHSFWIAAGAGLQGGPVGLIAPAILTARPPSDQNLRAPVPARLADPTYRTAYQQEALRIRRGKAWGGYVMGIAAWGLLLSVATAGN